MQRVLVTKHGQRPHDRGIHAVRPDTAACLAVAAAVAVQMVMTMMKAERRGGGEGAQARAKHALIRTQD